VPELPEVETVRRTLLPHVVGQRIYAVRVVEPRLRSLVDAEALHKGVSGRTVLGVRRRAKYLLFDLDDGGVLLVHLGMSGKLGVVPADRPARKHDHVILTLPGQRELRFNDARRFGMVEHFAGSLEPSHPSLVHLGIEPLDPTIFTGRWLHTATRRVTKPIKNFIMDATRVVGVGNIYACESLHIASIKPTLPAGKLTLPRSQLFVDAIQQTLTSAIEQGGTTLRDFVNVEGEAGYFAVRLQVYGREGLACGRCGTVIKRIVQAGRSTFYCRQCQR
jgi:formamidopyrimidine-DNA glycosylase